MLIGLPGSGKSTFRSSYLRAYPDHVVASSDDFIDDKALSEGRSYSDAFHQHVKTADTHCFQVFEQTLKTGGNVIVDRTNMSRKSRRRFLDRAPPGCVKIAYLFEVEASELTRRLAVRAEQTGKHIPESVITSMRESFAMPSPDEFDIIARIVV